MTDWNPVDLLPGLYAGALALLLWSALRRWYDAVPVRILAVFAVVLVVLFGPVLFGGKLLLPLDGLRGQVPFRSLPPVEPHGNLLQGDLLQLVAPAQAAVRAALKEGRLPLVNPLAGEGTPLLADPQAQVLQPIALAALPLPWWRAAGVMATLRVLLALTFTYAWMRRQGLGEGPALAGALAYGLGGFVLLWVGWPIANAAALLPAVLYALARCHQVSERRDFLLLTLTTAALLLAGHPETIAYALGISAIYWVGGALSREAGEGRGGGSPSPSTTSSDLPGTSSGLPATSLDRPTSSLDRPTSSSDRPTTSPDRPLTSRNGPATSSDLPGTSPDRPTTSSDSPKTFPSRSSTSSDRPTTSLEGPRASPDLSTPLPDRPKSLPDRPSTSSSLGKTPSPTLPRFAGEGATTRFRLRRILLALAFSVLIASPALLPALDALPRSLRATRPLTHPTADLARHWLPIAAPNAYGNSRYLHYWGLSNTNEDAAGFVGTITLLAALTWTRKRLPQERLFLGIAVVCLLLLSPWGPGTRRLLLPLALSLAYLGACTLERVRRGEVERRAVILAAAVLGTVIAWGYLTHGTGQLEVLRLGWLHWQGRFLILGTLLLLLGKGKRWTASAAAGLIAAELLLAHLPANPPMPKRLLLPETGPVRFLQDHLRDGGRMAALGRDFPPNLPTLYGLPDIRVYNPMAPASYFKRLEPVITGWWGEIPELGNPGHPLYRELGVRYILTAPDATLPLPLAFEDQDGRVWEVTTPAAPTRSATPESRSRCARRAARPALRRPGRCPRGGRRGRRPSP